MAKEGNIWLISDTHLYHDNILGFKDRADNLIRPGFANVAEMNELIYDNWNETVKKGDIVYHLGDVVMGRPDTFSSEFRKLPGRKRLVVGNHDDIKWITGLGLFQKISMWRMFVEHGVLLTHVPVHESSLRDNTLISVHGHLHYNLPPRGNYVNVCVEQTNYFPINLDQVRELMRSQQKEIYVDQDCNGDGI